jgi:transcriptional regulator with XRE-family HTH domain
MNRAVRSTVDVGRRSGLVRRTEPNCSCWRTVRHPATLNHKIDHDSVLGVAPMAADSGALIERARVAAGLSQRALADAAGISQPTLSRIISGERAAKMPEVVAIAWATGHTVAQLTEAGTMANRVQYAARATHDSGMDRMREALLHFLELHDYLDDQAIPATV